MKEILESHETKLPKKRKDREILEEILILVRNLPRMSSSSTKMSLLPQLRMMRGYRPTAKEYPVPFEKSFEKLMEEIEEKGYEELRRKIIEQNLADKDSRLDFRF